MKCCDCCRYAVYETYPYGMGSASEMVDCRKADDMTEEEFEVNWEEGGANCPFFEDEDHGDYSDYMREEI